MRHNNHNPSISPLAGRPANDVRRRSASAGRGRHMSLWAVMSVFTTGLFSGLASVFAGGLAGGLIVLSGLSSLSGCGGDPPPSTLGSSTQRRSNSMAAAAPPSTEVNQLNFYPKIDDIIGEEANTLRHRFAPEDFEPDPTGVRNRDPFRSYVTGPTAVVQTPTGVEQPVPVDNVCRSHVAENFSLRDLRLVGIVLRGANSYALFVDSAADGHVIARGYCVGQEKARVSAIRAGFVNLTLVPETGTSATALPTQERIIPLYPNELTVDGEQ